MNGYFHPLYLWDYFISMFLLSVLLKASIIPIESTCFVMQFLSRNGIECNDLEDLFIKDQSLSNESKYFGFGFFTFFLKNINLNPF